MKANEIRLGNYLEMLGKVRKVECISNLPARKEMYWLTCENMIDTKIIHFSPIELNKEWLLNLGFENIKDNDYYLYPFTYRQDKIRIGHKTSTRHLANDIKYVHQLQNLFFAITGTELSYENKTK